MSVKRQWRSPDPVLLVIVIGLCAAGLVALMSAAPRDSYWQLQARWMGIGLCGILVLLFFDYRFFLKHAWWIYALVMLALLTAGLGELQRGQRALLNIGSRGIQFSEFAKLAMILAIAAYLAKRVGEINGLKDMTVPLLLAIIPTGIVKLQGDLGTALTFLPICIAMLYASGMKAVYLLLFISPMIGFLSLLPGHQWTVVFLAFLVFLYFLMRDQEVPMMDRFIFLWANAAAYFVLVKKVWEKLDDYQKDRLLVFSNAAYDTNSAGYHINQSMIAIGSGGLLGKGWKQGTQSGLQFLPEQWTDFIFANWAEEWGFIGSAALLGLFLIFFWRILDSGRKAKDVRGSLITAGVVALFAIHLVINIGMTIRLMPITGLPLLLISYGGSSVLMSLLAVGFVLNVRMRSEVVYRKM